jgi:hypothetical protein
VNLDAEKVYKNYDVTGDGKKDVIKFMRKDRIAYVEWAYNRFQVYVNGKCALTVKRFYFGEEIQMVTLKNGKKYIYLRLLEEDDDGSGDLYVYKNGKFVREVNLLKNLPNGIHPTVEIKKVSGNKIVFRNTNCTDVLGGIRYECTYQYRSGKLRLTSKTYKLQGYGWGTDGIDTTTKMFPLTRSVKLYSKKTLQGKTFTLKQGTKVKVTKIYISGKTVSYYLKTEDGKSGWLKDFEHTEGGEYYINPEPCAYG